MHSGAWYDGWETRRHNAAEYDWVVVRLGVASGRVRGIEVDTAFFNGNHAPEVGVQGAVAESDAEVAKDGALTEKAYTHVRLLMYPDGGIARFRLYGLAVPVFPADTSAVFDLASIGMGGRALSCSDQHFGTKDNLLMPGRGKDMGDGWETKRTRGPHVDWVVVRLAAPGAIDKILIDTAHFRGNFPKEVQVFASLVGNNEADPAGTDEAAWTEILSPQKTGPDQEHEYAVEKLVNVEGKKYSHAKLVIIPDGGVKRFRVFGRIGG